MIDITTREELFNYLRGVDKTVKKETEFSDIFFLVEYNNHVEPIHFMEYEDTFFESPCILRYCKMDDNDLISFVLDMYLNESVEDALAYERTMQRNGYHYEIDCLQTEPFLTMPCKIIDMLSETECLDWLIAHDS